MEAAEREDGGDVRLLLRIPIALRCRPGCATRVRSSRRQ